LSQSIPTDQVVRSTADGNGITIIDPKTKKEDSFHFDACLWSLHASPSSASSAIANQADVYQELGGGLLESTIAGFNTCILSYGQTGSGKTYTMLGDLGSATDRGLAPRLCEDLFQRIETAQSSGDVNFKVEAAFMEVYNEKVRDLLAPSELQKDLQVRQHPALGPFVQGLSYMLVTDSDGAMAVLQRGDKERSKAATKMNERSSRSHAIFVLRVSQQSYVGEVADSVLSTRTSKMCLVDLAGSERSSKSDIVSGARFEEMTKINLSLSTLSRVIDALVAEATRRPSIASGSSAGPPKALRRSKGIVPYRESMLTWILSDSLGGNSKTLMLATISPAAANYAESLSTLRYAARARKVQNRAVVNEDPSTLLIRHLQQEISLVRSQLADALELNRQFSAREGLREDTGAEVPQPLVNSRTPEFGENRVDGISIRISTGPLESTLRGAETSLRISVQSPSEGELRAVCEGLREDLVRCQRELEIKSIEMLQLQRNARHVAQTPVDQKLSPSNGHDFSDCKPDTPQFDSADEDHDNQGGEVEGKEQDRHPWTHQLSAKEAEIQALRHQMQEMETHVQDRERDIEELSYQLGVKDSESTALQREVQRLAYQVQELTQEGATLRDELERQTSLAHAQEATIAAMVSELDRVQRDLAAATSQGCMATSQPDAIEVANVAKNLEIRSLLAEVEGLRVRTADAETQMQLSSRTMEEERQAAISQHQKEVVYWRQRSVTSLAKCMKRCEEQMQAQQATHAARERDLQGDIDRLRRQLREWRVQAAVFPGFQPPEGAEKTDTPRPVTDDHSLASAIQSAATSRDQFMAQLLFIIARVDELQDNDGASANKRRAQELVATAQQSQRAAACWALQMEEQSPLLLYVLEELNNILLQLSIHSEGFSRLQKAVLEDLDSALLAGKPSEKWSISKLWPGRPPSCDASAVNLALIRRLALLHLEVEVLRSSFATLSARQSSIHAKPRSQSPMGEEEYSLSFVVNDSFPSGPIVPDPLSSAPLCLN